MKSKKKRRSVATGSEFVRLKDAQIANCVFVHALDRAIKFHSTNTNDPHNVGNAVIAALTEVRDAYKAYIC